MQGRAFWCLALGVWAAVLPALGQQSVPVGVEFQVNSYTVGSQFGPKVDLEPDGDFVVVWTSLQDGSSYGVFGRRFSSAGTRLATEFQVSTYTVDTQFRGRVAVKPNGAFVVSWSSVDAGGSDVFARRFDAAGAPLAGVFQLNSYTAGTQTFATVAAASNGEFVALWNGAGAGDATGVFGRLFNSSGTAQATEFRANSTTAGVQDIPSAGMDADGDFVVAWRSDDGSGLGVFAQRFTSSGSPTGPEFPVNTFVTGAQTYPAVALDTDGDFVIAWSSFLQDGGSYGVFARDGSYLPLTDGLLMLRFGFGFTGNALITGAVGPACTRCDAPSITAHLESLL